LKSKIILEKVDWQSFSTGGPVAGVDEVGRGCLAGPVVAAAVCLKSDSLSGELTDSKLLSEKRRDKLSQIIHDTHWVGIGSASVVEIAELNILWAAMLAMRRAVEALEKNMNTKIAHVLVDGNFKIPKLLRDQTALIKGDLRCAPISAASIVAKVYRDNLMKEMAGVYPGYGFEKHKGYASSTHKAAIAQIGVTSEHRKTFSGVKEYL
jgi:ribonuclease HII